MWRNSASVDPACGSGSFLIAAFQYLIDWHTAHYAQGSRNEKKYLEGTPSGGLRLSTAQRKRHPLVRAAGAVQRLGQLCRPVLARAGRTVGRSSNMV